MSPRGQRLHLVRHRGRELGGDHDRAGRGADGDGGALARFGLRLDRVLANERGARGTVPGDPVDRLQPGLAPARVGGDRIHLAGGLGHVAATRRVGRDGRGGRRVGVPLPDVEQSAAGADRADVQGGVTDIGLRTVTRPCDGASLGLPRRPELPIDHERVHRLPFAGAEVAVDARDRAGIGRHGARQRPHRVLLGRRRDIRHDAVCQRQDSGSAPGRLTRGPA